MICQFCLRTFRNSGGHGMHQSSCKLNPSRIIRKPSIHSGAKKGSIPHNKGKNTSIDVRNRISSGLKNNVKVTGKASTEESEILRRQKISNTSKKNNFSGGYREGSGKSIKQWYDSPIAGMVFLQSSLEIRYAIILDTLGINWRRNTKYFYYFNNWRIRKYYPDFYLIDSCTYVETKGFITQQDIEKIYQFSEKIKVLFDEDISKLEQQINNKLHIRG